MKSKIKKLSRTVHHAKSRAQDSIANIDNHKFSQAIYNLEDRLVVLRNNIMNMFQTRMIKIKNLENRTKAQFSSI
jgi:hypothetical protein